MKIKTRTYAVYQFVSFLAIFLIAIGFTVSIFGYLTTHNGTISWSEVLSSTMRFVKDSPETIAGGTLVYTGIGLFVVSWGAALFILRVNSRNFLDSLFVLFFFVPVLANIIALMAQIASKEYQFTSATIDRKDVKEKVEADMKKTTTKKTTTTVKKTTKAKGAKK